MPHWKGRAPLRAPDPVVPAAGGIGIWAGFAAMCVGMFMAILDVQIVATALPTIRHALDVAPDRMSWIQTAYLVAEVISIPLTGPLTRIFGIRRLFVAGICVFTLASAGCAASGSFEALVAWRIVQGFAGGTLIPAVFSAVFLLFPVRRQGLATMLGGVLAVLAPTLGPIVGGWVTQTYSWHWLFLVNIVPGIVCAVLAGRTLPHAPGGSAGIRSLDVASLMGLAAGLAALEVALKEAPARGWTSGLVLGLLALAASCAYGFGVRTWRAGNPIVQLRNFTDRNFAVGCVLSFALGIGLFGSVYLMPVFLAFVGGRDALEIGTIMLVTGAAQLAAAPVAVALERRVDARLLTAAGMAFFAAGLGLSAVQTPRTDGDGMFWPQVIRGLAVMFCLLPPTRLALGGLAMDRIPDASALFNLMRNLGGAIGLALVDTVIYGRTDRHAADLTARILAGDPDAAAFVGIAQAGPDPAGAASPAFRAMVETAALTQAINEAWAMMALITVVALACIPCARRPKGA
jgi:DHA2 family multidrug resistance protein